MSQLAEPEKNLVDALSELKKDTISFSDWVDVPKSKKIVKLILSVGKYRAYLSKVNLKKKKAQVVNEIHYLSIKTIEVSEKEMKIEKNDGTIFIIQGNNLLEFISQIRQNIAHCIPDAVDQLLEWKVVGLKPVPTVKSTPCGNFEDAYTMMCDFDGTPVREDVLWDIEHLYSCCEFKEFSFRDLHLISEKDFRCLLLALKYNTYFLSLSIDNTDEHIPEKEFFLIPEVLRQNQTLTKIRLSNLKTSEDKFWSSLFLSLQQNPSTLITTMEIVDCHWDSTSKAAVSLAQWLASKRGGVGIAGSGGGGLVVSGGGVGVGGGVGGGLTEFVLTHSGSIKKLSEVFESFGRPSTGPGGGIFLKKIDLTGVKLDTPSSEKLISFFMDNPALTHVNLAHTGISLPPLFNAFYEAKSRLKFLNVAGNKLQKKQTFQPILDYLSITEFEEFDISGTEFPFLNPGLEKVISTICGNNNIKNLNFIMDNYKLEKEGAELISRSLVPTRGLRRWSLVGCDLGDEGVRILLKVLERFRELEELDLSYNFKHPKNPQERDSAMFSVGEYLDCKFSYIHTLKILGQKNAEIGPALAILFRRLGEGSGISLTYLDASGNQSGDDGATALAKALPLNRTLRHLVLDKNGTTLRGFQALRMGVSRSSSLITFEAPLNDLMNVGGEEVRVKVVLVWREIEEILRKKTFVNFPLPTHNLEGNLSPRGGVEEGGKVKLVPILSIKKEDEEKIIPGENNPEKDNKSPLSSPRSPKEKKTKHEKSKTPHKTPATNTEVSTQKPPSDPKSPKSKLPMGQSPQSVALANTMMEAIQKAQPKTDTPTAATATTATAAVEPTPPTDSDTTTISYSSEPRLPSVKRVKGPNRRKPGSAGISETENEDKK